MNADSPQCGLVEIVDFPEWPAALHTSVDQLGRQASAADLVYLRNRSSLQERLHKYQTSCAVCHCPDFQRRKQPCKHIYALAALEGRIRLVEVIDEAQVEEIFMLAVQNAADVQPGWGGWDPIIHTRPSQQLLLKKAERILLAGGVTHRELRPGHFLLEDSTTDGIEVGLSHCSCENFKLRRLPCRHIYLLALELGKFAS